MKATRTLLAVIWFSAGNLQVAYAQPTLELRATCRACRPSVRELVRLQSLWDDGATSRLPAALVPFGRGEWLLADTRSSLIERFDSHGRRLGVFAPKGGGPGEVSRADMLVPWLGDSILVIDATAGRLHFFDATGVYRRGAPWLGSSPLQVLRTPNGRFIAPLSRNTRGGFGIPFYEFAASGELVRSFGASPDVKIASRSELPLYRVGARTGADGSFWSAEARTARLRHWNSAGELATEWTLPFRDFAPLMSTGPDAPPGAEFTVLEELHNGLVVLAMSFRSANHERAYGSERTIDGRTSRPIEDVGAYYDTRILILDPRTRSLVTFVDTDAFLLGSLGDGRFWGIATGGDNGEVVVVQVTFTR